MADMQESGVPVTHGYISGIHGNEHIPGLSACEGQPSALGSGNACYVAQAQYHDQAFATFFQRLAADGITSKNTLFLVSSDEGDHEAGANVGRTTQPTPANSDGATVSGTTVTPDVACTYPAGSKPDYFLFNGPASCGGPCVTQVTNFAYDHGDYAAEINTSWLGIAGPGVARIGLDGTAAADGPSSAGPDSGQVTVPGSGTTGTWIDETDIRPTPLYLAGLRDDYQHDGRVITEILSHPGAAGGGPAPAVHDHGNFPANTPWEIPVIMNGGGCFGVWPSLACGSSSGLGDWQQETSGDEGMLAMAEANGKVAVRDPDALIKEIERTRENLARTIDALTERVSPGHVARRALSRIREQASRPEVQVVGAVAGAATVALVAYALWRRRR